MDREFLQAAAAQAYVNPKMVSGIQTALSEPELHKILERIATAQKRIDGEIGALTNIADKLFGERPAQDEAAECQPCRSGRLGEALDSLDTLHNYLGRLTIVVSRFSGLV